MAPCWLNQAIKDYQDPLMLSCLLTSLSSWGSFKPPCLWWGQRWLSDARSFGIFYGRRKIPYWQHLILSSTPFAFSPLKYLHMERTCIPCPKIFLHMCILQIWEVRTEDLKALTRYPPYKGRDNNHKIWVSSMLLYKHPVSSSPRYVEFPNSHTWVIGDHSITNLTFRWSLAGTPLVLYVGSLGTPQVLSTGSSPLIL